MSFYLCASVYQTRISIPLVVRHGILQAWRLGLSYFKPAGHPLQRYHEALAELALFDHQCRRQLKTAVLGTILPENDFR